MGSVAKAVCVSPNMAVGTITGSAGPGICLTLGPVLSITSARSEPCPVPATVRLCEKRGGVGDRDGFAARAIGSADTEEKGFGILEQAKARMRPIASTYPYIDWPSVPWYLPVILPELRGLMGGCPYCHGFVSTSVGQKLHLISEVLKRLQAKGADGFTKST